MKKEFYILIALVFVSFLMSCDDLGQEKIYGNEQVIEKTRQISSFEVIESSGSFDVYYTNADTTSLVLIAEENLIPFIITKVDGSRLRLYTKSGYNLRNTEPIEIHITGPELIHVELLGSGLIQCDTLEGEELYVTLTGSGNIEFDDVDINLVEAELTGSGIIQFIGEASRADFLISGSGNIRAIDMEANIVYAEITGSGNIYTFVNDFLDVEITGSGNVYYSGTPEIEQDITGSGSVIRF